MSLRRVAALVIALSLVSALALAQDGAQDAGVPAASPDESAVAPPPETAVEEDDEADEADEADDEEDEEDEEEQRALDEAEGQIFPSHRIAPEPSEPDPELIETYQLPPPDPEWRLRAGVGATASTGGTDVLALRLTQEIEWMPAAAAPFLFGITGGEVLGGAYAIYLAGVRLGGYATFCRDRLVTCSGAVAIRVGATFGGVGGTQFDLGGDGDVRFRFDGVELGVRVGFFVVSSNTYVDALALVGAAF